MAQDLAGKTALVVGGGIAGVSASLDLSAAGLQVHLIERRDHLGGQAVKFGCKALDACQKCNVCLALDKFRKIRQDSNVHVHLATELTSLTNGKPDGPFQAELVHNPQLIDPAKCIACGLCVSACPAGCVAQAPPALGATHYLIDRSKCLALTGEDCRKCQEVCPTLAIDMGAPARTRQLIADAVLLAVGYEPYDALGQGTYGYGTIPNVITGLDAEHQLGDTATIVRPADGRAPQNVAFIQCVGSRTEETEPAAFSGQYCSAVCCAYAMRMSRLLAQKLPDSKITIFYMDLQKFGKDYETLYNDCREKVRLIRSRPSRLDPGPDAGILLTYEDVSQTVVKHESFDLVVLSIGIRPPAGARSLADMLNLETDQHGFLDPTARHPGLFISGTCSGPTDIAGTIERTSEVTARMLDILRGTPVAAGVLKP